MKFQLSTKNQELLLNYIEQTDKMNNQIYNNRGQKDSGTRKIQNIYGKVAELYVSNLIHANYEKEILTVRSRGSYNPDVIWNSKGISVKSQLGGADIWGRGRFSFSIKDPILSGNTKNDYIAGIYFDNPQWKDSKALIESEFTPELVCFCLPTVLSYATIPHNKYPDNKVILDINLIKKNELFALSINK